MPFDPIALLRVGRDVTNAAAQAVAAHQLEQQPKGRRKRQSDSGGCTPCAVQARIEQARARLRNL